MFVKTMSEIEAMLPIDRRKIRVMFDSGVTSKIAETYMRSQYDAINRSLGIDVDILTIGTQSEWRQKIRSAYRDGVGAIVVGLYHTIVDEQGSNVSADSILSWTNEHSPVPLFGFWDFSIGEGKAAGGVVLFGQTQGEAAGKSVMAILEGESANDIPINVGKKGKAIYHAKEMARWGLTPPTDWIEVD